MTTNYYLWRDVLCDYTQGCIFGFADSIEELKSLVSKDVYGYEMVIYELKRNPDLIIENVNLKDKHVEIFWGGA